MSAQPMRRRVVTLQRPLTLGHIAALVALKLGELVVQVEAVLEGLLGHDVVFGHAVPGVVPEQDELGRPDVGRAQGALDLGRGDVHVDAGDVVAHLHGLTRPELAVFIGALEVDELGAFALDTVQGPQVGRQVVVAL